MIFQVTNDRQEHIYRLTYEAFSQFSSRITKTRTFQEVLGCLESRVKYLFDFELLRVNFRYEKNWVQITMDGRQNFIQFDKNPHLFSFEKELVETGLPKIWNVKEYTGFLSEMGFEKDYFHHLWGWHFHNNEQRNVTISIGVKEDQYFGRKSIPFVKLFAEILEAKLLELVLFSKLEEKNKHIQASLEIIEEKNKEIQAIVRQQDKVIQEQTKDLKERNTKLVEISVFNAHNVREPLSRILGLCELIGEVNGEKALPMIPMLLQSSKDLDAALRRVIDLGVDKMNEF